MIAKQEQMANKAGLWAHGKAKPCGHPVCIFVGKTAGCVDQRLTLPKLHLATFGNYCFFQGISADFPPAKLKTGSGEQVRSVEYNITMSL